MSLEIFDRVHPPLEFEKIDATSPNPPLKEVENGLSAIKDSIHISVPHTKPPLLKRAFMALSLFVVHMLTLTFQFCCWIADLITGPCRQKALYRELSKAATAKDLSAIKLILIKGSQENHAAGYMMKELLAMPELHDHLEEILGGANVRLIDENGFFFQLWSQHPEAYQRKSSHEYQPNKSFALNHLLFWIDLDGNTRFQFENNPLKGLRNSIYHFIDYLRYRRDNLQQGVAGKSKHVEERCLTIRVNTQEFLLRKGAKI